MPGRANTLSLRSIERNRCGWYTNRHTLISGIYFISAVDVRRRAVRPRGRSLPGRGGSASSLASALGPSQDEGLAEEALKAGELDRERAVLYGSPSVYERA
ncbi:hypothetical protein NEMBOFW57_006657 [Staphylotrichum longicolle]|uniref:Uncharacterized protein n=1 Tax=Staphylotrichum longicolle TaxID=669026 RepID=A0AAD4EWZ6_9PEZI|nr:hypothetical protein NEMBOFW57_006657 [Staphylotrichum longicolle]